MLEYAYRHWSHHLRHCSASFEEINASVEQFILSSTSFPVICEEHVSFLGPLHLAAWYNLPSYLPSLVNAGHDLNGKLLKTNLTPLMLAASKGNKEFVKGLFSICGIRVDEGGAPKSKRRSTSLISSLSNILRVSSVNPNEVDDHGGRTALFLAAKGGNTGVVEMLLQAPRVQPEQADHQGRTPLIIAASQGHHGVVASLIKRSDLDVNRRDCEERTALIHAAAGGHLEVMRTLLERSDTEVDAVDRMGDSALSAAVRGGHLELIKLLVLSARGIRIGTALRAKLLILASSSGDNAFVAALLQQT
jgi:ankyrin repeat protein